MLNHDYRFSGYNFTIIFFHVTTYLSIFHVTSSLSTVFMLLLHYQFFKLLLHTVGIFCCCRAFVASITAYATFPTNCSGTRLSPLQSTYIVSDVTGTLAFLSNSQNGAPQEAQRIESIVAHSWNRVCLSVTSPIRSTVKTN